MANLPNYEDECFFIAPIGEEGSPERDRSDGILEWIVGPAALEVGLTAVRADQIGQPGIISRQVIEHLVHARGAVVDLTGANPNVYYEMAVRHTARLPTVLIADTEEKLPFDISQMRTIFFNHQNLNSASQCKSKVTGHLKEALEGAVDSPVSSSVTLQNLEQGNSQEKVLAGLVSTVEDLGREIRMLRSKSMRAGVDISEKAIRDFISTWQVIEDSVRDSDDPRMMHAVRQLGSLADYFGAVLRRRLAHEAPGQRRFKPIDVSSQDTDEIELS